MVPIMDKILEKLFNDIEIAKDDIIGVLDHIWDNPELGYREWKTHAYLKQKYEELGLSVSEVGDIPGFFVDIDTGRPGPKIAVFGEMDGLKIPSHPECDKTTGAVHACGHHTQCASVYGVARGLVDSEVLSALNGSVRLFAVPCEELVSGEFYENLKRDGKIKFYGGKKEFIRKGLLDDVDMAIMIHGGAKGFGLNKGCNGSINKKYVFTGKTAHVAGARNSKNALSAAMLAMNAANALRERFTDGDLMRYYATVVPDSEAPGNIPAKVTVVAGVRALTTKTLEKVNEWVDLAYAGAAISSGCDLTIDNEVGYYPRIEDKNLQEVFLETARYLYKDEDIYVDLPAAAGCTDMGDVSMLMPVCHAFVGDGGPAGHSAEFKVVDKYLKGVVAAKLQAGVIYALLKDGAVRAKKVKENYVPTFKDKEDYLAKTEKLSFKGDAVKYNEDGTITVTIR